MAVQGPAESNEPRRVLVVEDSPTAAAQVKFLLEQTGETVVTIAGSIGDARAALSREGNPACILLDLTLPDAENLEGLELLRGMVPSIAIVVLTGREEEELATAALRAGAQDYLVKGQVGQAEIARAVRFAIERKKADEVIVHQAFHDILTGLPGRAYSNNVLASAVMQHGRHPNWRTAVLYFDLDGFKLVNDTYGHQAGDIVLRAVADRVQAITRSEDLLARIGGDEFVYIAMDFGLADLGSVANRIIDAVNQSIPIGDDECRVGASVGVAEFRQGQSIPELMDRADRAMFEAKRGGGNNYVLSEI